MNSDSRQFALDRLSQSLAKASYERSVAQSRPQQTAVATVTGFKHGLVEVEINGGSKRYCRANTTSGIGVGYTLAGVFPAHSSYGHVYTKGGV